MIRKQSLLKELNLDPEIGMCAGGWRWPWQQVLGYVIFDASGPSW
jgi:hypothetical protein